MKSYLFLILITTLSFAQPKSKKLVWEEDFKTKELNNKNWNIELGDGCPNCGWGNNERQLYTNENHTLVNGKLVITAKKEGDKYSSTRITTKGKKEFQYGYIEAKAKLPIGHGIWPAFWMLGANIDQVGWPKCGEIDILEYVGKEPKMVFTSLHTQDSHGNTVNTKKTSIDNIEEGYHLYAIDWTKEKIDFFVDNTLVYTFNPINKTEAIWPYNQPFYLIINMAIGGSFGGPEVDDTIFPQDFCIDYIKVYQ
ncbi:glycoside hydrolase family 16 protein [Flavobacterium sp. NG2]|uniref:glycoside hydrolase family 16 protein n=1 Tax=Flavobacterium sp. NG2 TaxID=3097547 RepID=UPI002A7F9D3A|nr:glycoside hydrolase family 16 protein [Flavobacterium sp. NG2]WPR73014.1 glycoside hydrolase family 16 protein [Flavobacterium sp. NG2]